jgi:ABC-2 type transport system permease protein
LWKLFARKRTLLGFGVFVGFETLVLILLQLPHNQRGLRRTIERFGAVFEDYFSGLTLAIMILPITMILLGALFLCLVGGDIVAKEVEDGTMRMSLCRPISRLRLLWVKYATCVIFTFVFVGFVGLSALGAATLVRGNGGLFVAPPDGSFMVVYDFHEGLLRYLCAMPCLGLSLLTVTSFAFLLSCCNIKPAAATIGSLCLFTVDFILYFLPLFESYKPYLMTTHMHTWLNVFRDPFQWPVLLEDYAYLVGLDATFFLVGVMIFSTRDLKS